MTEVTFLAACQAAKSRPDLLVAVNLSALQFRDAELARRLYDIAQQEGVNCDQIEIEITERVLIDYADTSKNILTQLKQHGFRIALDDFGTGYSSLNHLRSLSIDTVKLDCSFFRRDDRDECLRLVRAAVGLGHALNLKVVAEGISTSNQEEIAIRAGCAALQGYLYAPALPLQSIQTFELHKFGHCRAA